MADAVKCLHYTDRLITGDDPGPYLCEGCGKDVTPVDLRPVFTTPEHYFWCSFMNNPNFKCSCRG